MNKIGILLPTYKRPHAIPIVAKNIEENTKHDFVLWFGLEADDEAGQRAAQATGHKWLINKYEPSYPNTIQTLYEADDSEFVIHANDDFIFKKDWDAVPVAMFERKDLMVVGLKQTESDYSGSAIHLLRRKYIEEQSAVIDMPNRFLYPYNHNYVDTELTETAQFRGVWAMCDQWVIDHRHPILHGINEKDETYKKNDATAPIDQKTYESRKHLWGK